MQKACPACLIHVTLHVMQLTSAAAGRGFRNPLIKGCFGSGWFSFFLPLPLPLPPV